MQIRIQPNDSAPIYQQIVRQVKSLVASGRVPPGEELPSIRALAEQLVVNPNTVARAYRELEADGIVSVRRASGTYVSASAPVLDPGERPELLVERVDNLLDEARRIDVSVNSVIDLVRARGALIERTLETFEEKAVP